MLEQMNETTTSENEAKQPSRRSVSGLASAEASAVSLLAALPIIFHVNPLGELNQTLSLNEVLLLGTVYSAALIGTLLIKGLRTLLGLAWWAMGIWAFWLTFFWLLWEFLSGRPALAAHGVALTLTVLLACALLLQWNLLPISLLDHLREIARRTPTSDDGNGAEAEGLQTHLAVSRTLAWGLFASVIVLDVMLGLTVSQLARAHAAALLNIQTAPAVWIAYGVAVLIAMGVGLTLAIVLRQRLRRCSAMGAQTASRVV
jgi:hypothetical protein